MRFVSTSSRIRSGGVHDGVTAAGAADGTLHAVRQGERPGAQVVVYGLLRDGLHAGTNGGESRPREGAAGTPDRAAALSSVWEQSGSGLLVVSRLPTGTRGPEARGMTPTISVLLPTVRPTLARKAIASVLPAADEVSVEVIVVANFAELESLPMPVRWRIRPRTGPVEAVNAALALAEGEYLFLLNDEATLDPGALARLYHSAICDPDAIFAPVHRPGYTFQYYGRPFVPFPFGHRDVFARLGGLLDPAYRAFYADPDLGMRAHAAGVSLRTIDGAVIRHANGQDEAKQENVAQYMAADQATFRARWDHLGEFCDC